MLDKDRIQHRITYLHTYEQNEVVKSHHRRIIENGLALLSTACMPLTLWPYAICTVVFLLNRFSSKVLSNLSPFELLYDRAPLYDNIKEFNSQCFPYMHAYNKHKLEPRALECVFLGYCSNQKGYLCFHVSTNKIIVRRHVIFNENVFSFSKLSSFSIVLNVSPTSIIIVHAHFPAAKTSMPIISIPSLVTNQEYYSHTSSPIISPSSLHYLYVISSSISASFDS